MAESKQENRVLAAVAYPIPLIGLFIVFTDLKKDEFMKYHGWQSVFWGILWLIVYLIFWVLLRAFLFSTMWGVLYTLSTVAYLAFLLLSLYFAYRTYQGERFTIPYVSEYAAKYGK